jgi:hypothetical protein
MEPLPHRRRDHQRENSAQPGGGAARDPGASGRKRRRDRRLHRREPYRRRVCRKGGCRFHAGEFGDQIRRGRKSIVGGLGEATRDRAEQTLGNAAADRRQGNRIFANDGGKRLRRGGARECAPAGEHLVDDEAERKLIGSEVRRASRRLLGRHVANRPEDHSLERRRRHRRRHRLDRHRRGLRGIAEHLPGEAEVEDLRPALGREHDVLRLEVAVHHAFGVRRGKSFGDLPGDRARVANRERPIGERLSQRAALDPLHRDPGDAVFLADVVDGHDRRVIERRGRSCLELEAAPQRRIADPLRRDHLQRDLASQPRVAAAIDFAHSADADQPLDAVRTEAVARRQRIDGDDAAQGRRRRQQVEHVTAQVRV